MEAKSLGNLLKAQGIISDSDWSTLERACESKPMEIIKGITALGLISEQRLTNILAQKTGAEILSGPLIALFDRDVLDFVDPILVQKLEFVPLKELENHRLLIATANPLDRSLIRQLEFFTGRKIVAAIATPTQIQECLEELIEGYEVRPSAFRSFISQFAPSVASRAGASSKTEVASGEFFEDVSITEDEKNLVFESDDLDLAGLNTLEGDDEVSFSEPHEHVVSDDEETLDFGTFGESPVKSEVEDDSVTDELSADTADADLADGSHFDDDSSLDLEEAATDDDTDFLAGISDASEPDPEAEELALAVAASPSIVPEDDENKLADEISDDLQLEGLDGDLEAVSETAGADLADAITTADDLMGELESDGEQSSETDGSEELTSDLDFDLSAENAGTEQFADLDAELNDSENMDQLTEEASPEPAAPMSSEPFDQAQIDALFGNHDEPDTTEAIAEIADASEEALELATEDELTELAEDEGSQVFDQSEIDTMFADVDAAEESAGALSSDEDFAAEDVLAELAEEGSEAEEATDTADFNPSGAVTASVATPPSGQTRTTAAPAERRLQRSVSGDQERGYNTANIGKLNRALMDLQFTDESSEAARICYEALSIVFEHGVVFCHAAGDNPEVFLVWDSSGQQEEIDTDKLLKLNELAQDFAEGWNSDVSIGTEALPWDAVGELFIYRADIVGLGPIIWISLAENSQQITTGIAATCKQILRQFVDFIQEVRS